MSHVPPIERFGEINRPLVEALRSDDPEVQREVLDELAPLVDDEIALELVRLVRAPGDEDYRAQLAFSLGPVLQLAVEAGKVPRDADSAESLFVKESQLGTEGFEATCSGLETTYRDAAVPAGVRRAVLETAVRAPQAWQEGAVRSAWSSGDPAWQTTAVFCMGFLGAVDFAGELAAAWRSEEATVRREALLAAVRRGDSRLLADARRVARDEGVDPRVRAAAVDTVGAFGDDRDVELLDDLMSDRVLEVADAADEALTDIRLRRILPEDDPFDRGL